MKTADVGLGQSCSSGDSCVDASLGLVCDPVTAKCSKCLLNENMLKD